MKDYNYYKKEFAVKGKELLEKIEELIHQGNITRIIIKNSDGRPYIEIPVTIGVVGAFFAPVLTAVGALAGMAANFKVEIVKREPKDDIPEADIVEEEK